MRRRPSSLEFGLTRRTRTPWARPFVVAGGRFGARLGLAVMIAVAGRPCAVHATGTTGGSPKASTSDPSERGDNGGNKAGEKGRDSRPGGLLLAVTTQDLTTSARRDFELNLTRGLRFSGLDVVAESAGGAAPALTACADPACVRAVGTARSALALARASIRVTAGEARNEPRPSYAIEIEAVPTATGRATVQRRNVCTSCTSDVATHLAYLLAVEVGQKLAQSLAERSAAATTTPAAMTTPATTTVTTAAAPEVPPGPAPRADAKTRPIALAPTSPAPGVASVALAPTTPPAPNPIARDSAENPSKGLQQAAAGVLGGLGVAAVTTGAILWLRGPQSTCPGLPPSACGRTYDDTTTGQVLVGAGAAALAGAIAWWSWTAAAEPSRPRVAITSNGLIVGGHF